MAGGSPLETMLSRLDGARRSGKGWQAKCPAHADRSPSLSILECDDRRVLLKCHAGCTANEIVAAVGLSLSDLFERVPHRELSRAERAEFRERVCQHHQRTAIATIEFECGVIVAAAGDLAQGRSLLPEDHERLVTAMLRVSDARQAMRGRLGR